MTKTIDFSTFSSIKIGPVAEVFLIEDEQDYPKEAFIIGHGNNLLVSPTPPKLTMLSKKFDYIRLKNGSLIVGGATPSGKILSFCKKHDIKGFEFLSKLPGTLGGMVKMNAGLKGHEIFNNLVAVRTKNGLVPKEKIAYGYRYTDIQDVVFEAVFAARSGFDRALVEKFRSMRANQPQEPSAGSAFKNPPGDYAGRLIEAAGLKGYRIGNMAFSEKHANFLVNLGHGTFKEAIKLIELAKKEVLEKFGILLQEEIVIVGPRE